MNIIFRSLVYDWLYGIADYLLKKYPVCNIHIENGEVRCNRKHGTSRLWEPCCGGCEHLGQEGCTVKCLACKLGFCYEGNNKPYFGSMSIRNPNFVIDQDSPYLPYINNYKHIEHFLDQAWLIGKKFNLLEIRTSKEQLFNEKE